MEEVARRGGASSGRRLLGACAHLGGGDRVERQGRAACSSCRDGTRREVRLQLLGPEALLGVGRRGVQGEAVVDELPLPRGAVPERARLVDGLRQLAPIALDAQLP